MIIIRRKNKFGFFCLLFILIILFPGMVFSFTGGDTLRQKQNTITLLACGDINLGRKVGQRLLKGELEYPFVNVKDTFKLYDIVFGNLESQLSDQDGETQNPRHNLVFTGPPEGSKCLKENLVSVVSTANNHAFDYGKDAFLETIDNLKSDSVSFIGTSIEKDSCYKPLIIEKNGLKIAFFAVTDFINIPKKEYKGFIAFPDTSLLFPEIRKIRPQVDIVICSYHGGVEYVDKPLKKTVDFAHELIDCGIDLFLGHHPHVTQGIELYKNKPIFYSFGNFVFYQPQKYWTQRSFMAEFCFSKSDKSINLDKFRLIPVKAGLQPEILDKGEERDKLIQRIEKLSPTIKNLF
jgi:poly-gamma-glutamate capsule biosynthesis protein CapA/YwtB (metallophosphatase superfamily)